jgi:hypothetical protein
MDIKRTYGNGLKTGLVLAATTTATIMLMSDTENGAPWAAINAVTHIVDGDDVTQPQVFSPRESGLGIVINGTAMSAWGILYEGALALTKTRSNLLTGGLAAAIAWVIDYKVVPPRFAPGIEKKLSRNGIFVSYAIMGITFGLSSLWNKQKNS